MSKNRLSSLEKRIKELLKTYPDASIPTPLLADILNMRGRQNERKIKNALNRLAQLEYIRVTKGGLLKVNEPAVTDPENVFNGKVDITSHGDGYVIVEGRDQDIKINSRNLGTALHSDIVMVKLTGYHKKSNKPMGKIVEIVERSSAIFVGTMDAVANNTFVIKTDPQ